MKKLIVLLSLLITTPLFAAIPVGGTKAVVSQEDAAKVRDGVKALGQAFGVAPPAPPQQPTSTAPTKSVAEVADHALDMLSGVVANISNAVEKVAPHIYHIMVVQQYSKAISGVIVPFMLLIMVGLYGTIIRKYWKKPEKFDKDYYNTWNNEYAGWVWTANVAPTAFGIAFFIWFAISCADSIQYAINPEYYAVKDILTMILNPGAMN